MIGGEEKDHNVLCKSRNIELKNKIFFSKTGFFSFSFHILYKFKVP